MMNKILISVIILMTGCATKQVKPCHWMIFVRHGTEITKCVQEEN
jgi:hypothetical protein